MSLQIIETTESAENIDAVEITETTEQLKLHINALIAIEPRFAPIYDQVGVPDLRRNTGGFEQLLRAMVGQQLSVAAASSIWKKLLDANLTSPQTIIQVEDDILRAQGLSKQKIRYARSLVEHDIDFEALTTMSDNEVLKTLTAVVGIGRWTAEMYLLFSLGRSDVLAVDDLAIKVAAMHLLGLAERPTPKQLETATKEWSPHRSAASLLLWSHYGWLNNRKALPV
ncbi:DNA-3-methyladenine glycosylase family protein [Psychrobacter sp. DAB_AL43B]|uniref:DNA-3-methyladenine glycosylase family protein n=1 Tax=Psychrobacter sp. DAB_AL43B TaxID=1028416 RepID=UPI0009A79C3A|nr:DNA-3-methyladenine glycosylase [Psychrobacter sp. DAB_AL43B]SLJ84565.1 DNA-3-methyladenine glycosylase II [Psychrobacter sp. DAB_AL43B]